MNQAKSALPYRSQRKLNTSLQLYNPLAVYNVHNKFNAEHSKTRVVDTKKQKHTTIMGKGQKMSMAEFLGPGANVTAGAPPSGPRARA